MRAEPQIAQISQMKMFFRKQLFHIPSLFLFSVKEKCNDFREVKKLYFKKFILAVFSFFIFHFSFAQEIWYPEIFIQTQGRLTKDGSIGLCSWGAANAAYSAYLLPRVTGEQAYYHKMNLAWSGVNLAVGIPTLIRSHKIYKGKIKLQLDNYNPKRYLKIYSINGWLDVACIGAGIIIKSKAGSSSDPEMMNGFGNAILVQGGFLFTFDSVMYLLHRKLLKNHIRNQSQGIKNF